MARDGASPSRPATLLLDEPTTYLDLAHQIDVLELCRPSVQTRDMTIVVVMHELNLAIRYADHLIVMRGGEVQAVGSPGEVVTEELIERDVRSPVPHRRRPRDRQADGRPADAGDPDAVRAGRRGRRRDPLRIEESPMPYVELDGIAHLLRDARREATPVLLLHGGFCSMETLRPQVDRRCRRRTEVHAPERPGQGRTADRDGPITFDGHGPRHGRLPRRCRSCRGAHVVGFSDGAITGLLLARDHPERVLSLVSISANLDPAGLDRRRRGATLHQ